MLRYLGFVTLAYIFTTLQCLADFRVAIMIGCVTVARNTTQPFWRIAAHVFAAFIIVATFVEAVIESARLKQMEKDVYTHANPKEEDRPC